LLHNSGEAVEALSLRRRRRYLTEHMSQTPPYCLIEDRELGAALLFEAPRAILCAQKLDEVAPAFAAMEQARQAGYHLAGFAAYECGYAFEPRLARLAPSARPLLRFGVFDPPRLWSPGESGPASVVELQPLWSFDDYRQRFEACREKIFAGDIYQINLTFPFAGRVTGAPLDLYRHLRRRQPVELGGVVALGGDTIVSLSPERFFVTEGRKISTRPMKGTAPRGATLEEDRALAEALAASEKNRAENLMIVDLLRNDLSRLSEVGSVKVEDLFKVESFPTLHQMTSHVEALLRPGLSAQDIFAGLFPCGSITGAPKIRAMELIAELEETPRGAYCGALGMIAPNGDMRFNVAIRTLTLDGAGGVSCPVGSAIVADSQAREEYDECLLKARFLTD
jgi:para-aminobenzoate synthetase component I